MPQTEKITEIAPICELPSNISTMKNILVKFNSCANVDSKFQRNIFIFWETHCGYFESESNE